MKSIARFFLSLKTLAVFFSVFIIAAFIGSLMLPNNLSFFSGIDDTQLFKWLASSGSPNLTWWIYALIFALSLVAISTVFCTAEAFLKMSGWKNIMLKLSPQVMHIGVLFIMLGHLLTASQGFKLDVLIKKSEQITIAGATRLYLHDVKVEKDENGYDTELEARLSWFEGDKESEEKILKPVHPLYFGRTGLYLKAISIEPEPSALIRVCKDPGALWALLGGILLSIGGMGFIYGRFST